MDEYKVYACLLPGGGGEATVILSGAKDNNFWCGEYFVVLQKDCALHSHNFRIDEHAFAEPPDGTELNTDFILEQARMRAESRLHEHLTRAYEESGNAEFISRLPIWHNSNQNRLVHLWMSELCREAIKSVAQKTECKKLQDFLAWLTGRP